VWCALLVSNSCQGHVPILHMSAGWQVEEELMRIRTVCTAALGVAALALAGGPAQARFSPYLTSLTVGGGVVDFARDIYRSRTSPGGAWDATLDVGTRFPIGAELGYVGTAQAIQDPIGPNPTLVSHSVEGLARVNLLTWRVQPFVVGGVGYINYHSYGRDQAPVAEREFNHEANGLVVPVGGGLATYFGTHGLVDARFTYRFVPRSTMDNPLSPDANARPDTWTVMLRGGYAF
jgi:hypothetical protein